MDIWGVGYLLDSSAYANEEIKRLGRDIMREAMELSLGAAGALAKVRKSLRLVHEEKKKVA